MIRELAVPFRDAGAGDLGFALGHADPARAALAELVLELGGARVSLRVLGGSHEVRLAHGGAEVAELVACDGPCGPLPARHGADLGPGRYDFRAATRRLAPAALAAEAGRLEARLGADPHALVGRFPGDPAALTALEAWGRPGRLGWRTWHLYPRTGEVVCTASVVSPA